MNWTCQLKPACRPSNMQNNSCFWVGCVNHYLFLEIIVWPKHWIHLLCGREFWWLCEKKSQMRRYIMKCMYLLWLFLLLRAIQEFEPIFSSRDITYSSCCCFLALKSKETILIKSALPSNSYQYIYILRASLAKRRYKFSPMSRQSLDCFTNKEAKGHQAPALGTFAPLPVLPRMACLSTQHCPVSCIVLPQLVFKQGDVRMTWFSKPLDV